MSSEKLPINIDLGAKLEIKTSLPEKSSGRFLDQLSDLISPLTQWAGMKGDQLRIQRQDNLLKITRMAREIVRAEGGVSEKLPLKVVIPLLEGASLEEDETLSDWWARLIARGCQSKDLQHPIFSEFMKKITIEEARFLEKYINLPRSFTKKNEADFNWYFSALVLHEIREAAFTMISGLPSPKMPEKEIKEATINAIEKKLDSALIFVGMGLISYDGGNGTAYISSKFWDDRNTIDTLSAIGIMRRETHRVDVIEQLVPAGGICDVFQFTQIGRKFLEACNPNVGIKNG